MMSQEIKNSNPQIKHIWLRKNKLKESYTHFHKITKLAITSKNAFSLLLLLPCISLYIYAPKFFQIYITQQSNH